VVIAESEIPKQVVGSLGLEEKLEEKRITVKGLWECCKIYDDFSQSGAELYLT